MSSLHHAADDYLTVRRALGFKLADHGRLLTDFVTVLEQAGARTITTELALTGRSRHTAKRALKAARLSVVRGFARYLQTFDPATEVPPTGPLPPASATIPYLYSSRDRRLLAAATTLRPPLTAADLSAR